MGDKHHRLHELGKEEQQNEPFFLYVQKKGFEQKKDGLDNAQN